MQIAPAVTWTNSTCSAYAPIASGMLSKRWRTAWHQEKERPVRASKSSRAYGTLWYRHERAHTLTQTHTQLITIANFSAITVTSLTPISVSNSNSHPAQLTHDMPSAFALGIIFFFGKSQFLHHINQLKEPNTILIFNTKTYFSTASAHPWRRRNVPPPFFWFLEPPKSLVCLLKLQLTVLMCMQS